MANTKDKFKDELLKSLNEIEFRAQQELVKFQTAAPDSRAQKDAEAKQKELRQDIICLSVFAHRLGYKVMWDGTGDGEWKIRKYKSRAEKAESDSFCSWY